MRAPIPAGAGPDDHELLALVVNAQRGDDASHHELQRRFAPLIGSAIAPYRHWPALHEELHGEAVLAVHRLVMQFDPGRGVRFTTYLVRTLPPAIHTAARPGRYP